MTEYARARESGRLWVRNGGAWEEATAVGVFNRLTDSWVAGSDLPAPSVDRHDQTTGRCLHQRGDGGTCWIETHLAPQEETR